MLEDDPNCPFPYSCDEHLLPQLEHLTDDTGNAMIAVSRIVQSGDTTLCDWGYEKWL